MYVRRPGLFLGLGLLLIPIAFLITVLQWLLLAGIDVAGVVTGEAAGTWAFVAAVIGTALALLGLGLVQTATAFALVAMDTGRSIGAVQALRQALEVIRPFLRALGIYVVVFVVLTTSVFLVPIAIWLAIRWALIAPVVALERSSAGGTLRRSGELVQHRWIRTASLVGVSGAIALLLGPLLGAILIFLSDLPLATLNLVAGVVYALSMPFVALVTAYVYFDARTRVELEPAEHVTELPAEISLESR
jgi:hypothetical protein